MVKYGVHKGSQSGHCCFKFTVVYLLEPEIIGGEHYKGSDGQYHYKALCECWDEEEANRICDALNYCE